MKLITFPHAGGFGGYYYPLKKISDNEISVDNYEYPGHGGRFAESLKEEAEEAIQSAYEELFQKSVSEKVVLFGHSMGATLCMELAVKLQEVGREDVLAGIILSGALPAAYFKPCEVDLKDRQAVIEYLELLGGTQPEIFKDQNFLDLYLHVVTTDLGLLDDYKLKTPNPPLKCAIAILYASDDPYIQPVERMKEWSEHTENFLGEWVYQGGHFYFDGQWDSVIRDIKEIMTNMKER